MDGCAPELVAARRFIVFCPSRWQGQGSRTDAEYPFQSQRCLRASPEIRGGSCLRGARLRTLRTALVLGGGGFLGSWLCDVLERDGVTATAVDRAPIPGGRDTVRAELGELDLRALFEDRLPDAVFHVAGTGSVPSALERPADDLVSNVSTTLSVLEALRRVEHRPTLVFVSSAAVYGEGRRFPMDEDHPFDPISPYGVSKLAAENYIRAYVRLYGLEAVIARPFSLYGPRQRKLVVYDLGVRILAGENPIEIDDRADVARDFVYVEDAAAALVGLARRAPAAGEAYNICSGASTQLSELAAMLVDAARVRSDARFVGAHSASYPVRWQGDPSRAQGLGITLPTSLRDGLARTVEWVDADRRERRPGSGTGSR